MEDSEFLISFDGWEPVSGAGMGQTGGGMRRYHLNVDNISKYWYILRDYPARKKTMRFYRLVEIPQEDGFEMMEEARRRDERERHMRELAQARKRVAELEAKQT